MGFSYFKVIQIEGIPEDAGVEFLNEIQKVLLLCMLLPQYVIAFCEVHCLFNSPLLT